MASTLILGGDRMALTMAKILSSVGERVFLVGSAQSARATLTSMLQRDVEADIPFQFVDDLKHQQSLLDKRMSNIKICERISDISGQLKAVVTTEDDIFSNHPFVGSVPVASLQGPINNPNHISVRMYEPIELTKMAQILVSPSTDLTALACIRSLLDTMGISEITREQADTADALLEERSSSSPSTLDDVIASILPSRKPVDHSHAIMH